MLEPSRTRNPTLPARILARGARLLSLVTHHWLNQSLAKHNRKPMQLIENNHRRPESILVLVVFFAITIP
jgi:hypothetical protein